MIYVQKTTNYFYCVFKFFMIISHAGQHKDGLLHFSTYKMQKFAFPITQFNYSKQSNLAMVLQIADFSTWY